MSWELPPAPTPQEIYLERHLGDAGSAELRIIPPDAAIHIGRFDNLHLLLMAIDDWRGRAHIYMTIQGPKPDIVSNTVIQSRSGIGNADIASIIRLPFDFDANHKVGGQATPQQVECALELAMAVRKYLCRMGWPLPALVRSGNGYHLIYRTPPIPYNAEIKEMLGLIYQGLDEDFSTDAVSFDTTVQNAGRIMRVPGSLNIKGAPADPPEVTVKIPPRWGQVQPRDLEVLAKYYHDYAPVEAPVAPAGSYAPSQRTAKQNTWCEQTTNGLVMHLNTNAVDGDGDFKTLNIIAWFKAHQHYTRHLVVNKHAVKCPWTAEHTTPGEAPGDSIVFEADGGWPGFFCHHQHCKQRGIADVLNFWGDADRFCTSSFAPGGAA